MPLLWDTRFELKPGTWVFVPTVESVQIGKEIKQAIERVWLPPTYYYHLRSGGHVKALEAHLHNAYFARLDIRDFFGSINKTRITRCVKDLFGYPEGRRIANLSTVIHPGTRRMILPFGFVQSPILASLCLYKSALGNFLDGLWDAFGVVVTVYVDDLILSCNDQTALRDVITEIKRKADRSGFMFNPDKEAGPDQMVTAFNVRLSHQSLEIEPHRFAEIVEAFRETDSERVRDGIRGYVNSVNPSQATLL